MIAPDLAPFPGPCAAGCGATAAAGEGYVLAERPTALPPGPAGPTLVCASCWLATAPECPALAERLATPTADGALAAHYQVTGATWLARRWAGLLADDMGLGKTAQGLLALPAGAAVVVTVPAGIVGQWTAEAARWRPDLRVRRGRGGWSAPRPGELVIRSYEGLPPAPPCGACGCGEEPHREVAGGGCACGCPAEAWRPDAPGEARARLGLAPDTVLLADECSAVKNPTTRRSRRFRGLAVACARRWGLDASPLQLDPRELRHLHEALGLDLACWGTGRAFARLFAAWTEARRAPDGVAAREIRARRACVELRRTPEQVGLDLPPLRVVERVVELTPEHRAAVEAALAAWAAEARAWREVAAGTLADPRVAPGPDGDPSLQATARARFDRRLAELRAVAVPDGDLLELVRAAIDSGTDDGGDDRDADDDGARAERPARPSAGATAALRRALALAKLPAAIAWAEELAAAGDERAVALCCHVAVLQALSDRPGAAWRAYTGAASHAERAEIMSAFARGECSIGVSVRAGGRGLDGLQRARLCLRADIDWNPEVNRQALGRLRRRGQARSVLVTDLVIDHPLERAVRAVVLARARLIEATTGAEVTA